MDYSKILAVLRVAEQKLTGIKSIEVNQHGARGYIDTMLVAPSLVMVGAKVVFWRFIWILIAGTTFALVLITLGGGQFRQILTPAFVVGLGVVYFGVPSRALTTNVKAENVAAVREFILSITWHPKDLRYLHDGIMIVRAYSMEKLSRFSVLIGIGWGALFWYASTHVLAVGLSPEDVGQGLSLGLAASLVFGLVLFVGACYSTAVRALFQTLEIAVLEAGARFSSYN